MNKTILLLSLTVFSTTIVGLEGPLDTYNIRQKAMGGTQVTAIKDSTAFYQNPAFLATEESFKIAIPRIGLGVNQDLVDNQDTLDILMNSTVVDEQIEALKSLTPSDINMTGSALPWLTFTKKHFGITAYSTGTIIGKIIRPTSPTLEIEGEAKHTLQLGIATTQKIFGKEMFLGISPKYTIKDIVYDASTGDETFEFTQSDLLKYINGTQTLDVQSYAVSGFGLDAGVLFPYKSKRIDGLFGMTLKNIFSSLSGTKSINDVNNSISESEDFLLTVGTSFDYDLPILKKFHLATDINLIANTDNVYKRIHMGVEKKLSPLISLRGGIHEGFIVGGFGINIYLVKLDYAFFAEEYSSTLGEETLETHSVTIGVLF